MPSSVSCARMSAAAAGAAPARRIGELSPSGGQRGKSSSSASAAPPQPLSTSPSTPLALHLHLRRRSPRPSSSVTARAFFKSSGGSGGNGGYAAASAAATAEDDGGARALLAYSQAVTADDIEFFTRAAPEQVVLAMTETVSGLLGSLASSSIPASASAAIASSSSPISSRAAAAFDVRVRARDADLGQLLYSTLMTGYLMRNAASRLSLRSRLSAGEGGAGSRREGGNRGAGAALPASAAGTVPSSAVASEAPPQPLVLPSPPRSSSAAEGEQQDIAAVDPTTLPPEARAAALASLEGTPRLAPGAQTKKVEGDVLKWDQTHGVVSVPAAAYIKALEAELAGARAAATAAAASAAAAAAALEKEGGRGGAAAALPSTVSATAGDLPPPPAAAPSPSPPSPLSNPLLSYLRSADEASLTSLTAEASAGVLEAANAFVQRVMTGGESSSGLSSPPASSRAFGAGGFGVAVAGSGGAKAEGVVREYRASELRHLLLFVMVVGFMLRTLEARLDIEFSMLLPPAVGEQQVEEEEG